MIIAGFDLRTKNENGEQFGFSVTNGRIAGHMNAIIQNWARFFANIPASGKQMYAQIQLYMISLKLDENPCLFTVLNKDTSELYHELIVFDAEDAQKYSDRAVQIIKAESDELLPCICNYSPLSRCKM